MSKNPETVRYNQVKEELKNQLVEGLRELLIEPQYEELGEEQIIQEISRQENYKALFRYLGYRPFEEQIGETEFKKIIDATIISAFNLFRQTKDLEDAIKKAKNKVDGKLKLRFRNFRIYYLISGLKVDAIDDPMKIGRVYFQSMGPQSISDFIKLQMKGGKPRDGMIRIIKYFEGKTCCYAEVESYDSQTASRLAMTLIQYTIDVLTYFLDFVDNFVAMSPIQISTAGAQLTRYSLTVLLEDDIRLKSVTEQMVGENFDRSLNRLKAEAEIMGFSRAMAILGKKDSERNTLEMRILSAIHWVGRGIQKEESRPEEAFLFYVIALESLVSNEPAEVSLQFTLKVAHLVIQMPYYPIKEIYDRCKKLYGLRSVIAHGRESQIDGESLHYARHFVNLALTALLNFPPFTEMTKYEDLRDWFEERLLGIAGEPFLKAM